MFSEKYNIQDIDFFIFQKLTIFQKETLRLLNINLKKRLSTQINLDIYKLLKFIL